MSRDPNYRTRRPDWSVVPPPYPAVLESPHRPMTEAELAQFRQRWLAEHRGPAAARRAMVLGGGVGVGERDEPRRDPGWLRRWWPLGLVAAALAFAIPETVAIIAPGEGGTLSEMTREWLGTSEGAVTVPWVVLTVLLAGFAVWFPVHLRRGWPWERRRGDAGASPDSSGDPGR